MINNYVICIQAFVKLDTLMRLLMSLENCIGIKKYTLIFYVDSTKNMPFINKEHWVDLNNNIVNFIVKYSETRKDIYKNILIFSSNKNVGPYKGCQNLIDIALDYSDYIIFTEDDCLISIDYLLFYENLFDQYIKYDKNAVGGSGISFLKYKDQLEELWLKIKKTKWINCTEFSITKNAWKEFGHLRGENTGDTKFAQFIKNHKYYYSFYPVISRTCKIGFNHLESHSFYHLGKIPEEEFCDLKTNNIYIDTDTYFLQEII